MVIMLQSLFNCKYISFMVSEYNKKELSHIAVVILGEFGHYFIKNSNIRRREKISDLNLNEISNT